MRGNLPVSDHSAEYSSPRGSAYPVQLEDLIPGSRDDRPKRSPVMYLLNPAPWKIGSAWPQRFYDLPYNAKGKRSPAAPRVSAMTHAEAKMHRDLHQARDNFATIFHTSPAILCIIQLNSLRYCEVNKAYEQHTGYTRDEVLGKTSLELGLWSNFEDREHTFQKLITKGRLLGHQRVFRTKTGEPLTTFLSAEIIEFDGEPCALVIAEDITMRQRSEEARLDLAQRLINAQEAESTRVARELHDNIGQSLALFSMELEKTRLILTGLSPDSDERLTHLADRLKDLGRAVGSLSHQLHSSELELLGFVAAVKGLCREFSEQYDVQVNCVCSGVPDDLRADISLCLFRVMQEGLHNIAKHSLAGTINIKVHGTSHSLYLSISDDGVGFAQNNSRARSGLGLTSMRERLHLIGGKFMITSKPGAGTRIGATVPIPITPD
jgi:PAS domain S-box-containing protein